LGFDGIGSMRSRVVVGIIGITGFNKINFANSRGLRVITDDRPLNPQQLNTFTDDNA
jgi:hypothetical protein